MTVTSTEAAREEPGDVGAGAPADIGSRRWAVLAVLCGDTGE